MKIPIKIGTHTHRTQVIHTPDIIIVNLKLTPGHIKTYLRNIIAHTRFWHHLFQFLFDFIECFLHVHSWLNWVDEDDDEVGLKEKPEDTRYIKRLHQNKTRSTGSVDKGLN